MKINVPPNTKTVTLNIVSDEMLELKKKIEQGMTELKLSKSGLSKAIGYSRNYLSECLRVGVSTEKQGVIIGKIDGLLGDVEDEQHFSHWVGKDYHNQEIARLKTEKLETIQDVKNAEAHIQKLAKEKADAESDRDTLAVDCVRHANKVYELTNELKATEKNMSVWRFLAWAGLIWFAYSVFMMV